MVIPVGVAARYFATIYLPWFGDNALVVRDWFVGRGVPRDTAATYVVVFVLDIPALFLIAALAILFFAMGTRLADSFAILLLLMFPYMDLPEFQPVSASHLLVILKAKMLTILSALTMLSVYVTIRSKRPRPESSRIRALATISGLATAIAASTMFWWTVDA